MYISMIALVRHTICFLLRQVCFKRTFKNVKRRSTFTWTSTIHIWKFAFVFGNIAFNALRFWLNICPTRIQISGLYLCYMRLDIKEARETVGSQGSPVSLQLLLLLSISPKPPLCPWSADWWRSMNMNFNWHLNKHSSLPRTSPFFIWGLWA